MTDLRTQLQTTLGDGYTLERELGGGGMSRVFVARENALGREVVVKVLAPELSASVSAERFTREIATAARLQQANIVPVLTAGTSGDVAYYTMPLVKGESLRAQLARGVSGSMSDRLSVLRDVARALAYAHGEGVIHRDIKPDNILLSGGAAVVTDFGIAKAISASRTLDGAAPRDDNGTLTQVGSSIGTPAYMAPEQAVGEQIDHRADLYAWGVVAYELLSGAHPFAGKTGTSQLIAAHIAETPRTLGDVAPNVPRDVAALVMQCLEKNPAQRPPHAAAVLERLSSISTLSTESAPDRSRRTPRARWFKIAVPAAAVAVVAAVAFWFTTRGEKAPTAPATQTVVVIPFDNLGAAEDAYFADGITEEIAGRLARVPGLSVIARASVLRYRGSNKSPQDIARELGAAYALSGSIRWARIAGASGRGANDSTMVRIVPALIRVSTGAQLWGEPLQQRLTDVFKVQADVAERVASALSLTLGAADLAAVRRPESVNADARDAQLLGRFLLKQRGLGNLKRAVEQFGQAIALDSAYARAWAGQAEASAYLPFYGDSIPRAQSSAFALTSALRAIALDSMQSDAHLALATVYEQDQRFNAGLAAAERAVQLDSGNAQAWKERGVLLLSLGRVADAEAPLRRALALEPLIPTVQEELALWFLAMGQVDSTVAVTRRMVADNADNATVHWYAEMTLGAARKFVDARAECIKTAKPEALCGQLWGDARGIRSTPSVRALLDTINPAQVTVNSLRLSHQAIVYAQIGALDSAFSRLQLAVRIKDPTVYVVINSSEFAPLHKDPRWAALMQAYRGRR